jgi:hypothetical protein
VSSDCRGSTIYCITNKCMSESKMGKNDDVMRYQLQDESLRKVCA